jgi:acetyl-CoA synthetase
MATGTQQIHFGGTYNAIQWMDILQNQKVNVWYTAPTALRMLMQEEEGFYQKYNFKNLKRIYSVGEPLNAEIYHWGKRVFGREIFDNGQHHDRQSQRVARSAGLHGKTTHGDQCLRTHG